MNSLSKTSLRVAVIGDGGWGTALALVLHSNGHKVTVWGPFADYISTVASSRENKLYLPGVPLPKEIVWTADKNEAISGADVVILASPTGFFRKVVESLAPSLLPTSILMSVAKGLDENTCETMSQIAAKVTGAPVAALSGPSFAREVARGVPTAVVVASHAAPQSRALQAILSNGNFRVYTSHDVIGVEIGGALKNVIAIAAGVSDGLGFGDNTRSALITRGLAEITRLGMALGAQRETFAGLSGAGDLMLTCNSTQSRNHDVGQRIGKGEKLKDILAQMKQVAEGVRNCTIARDLAHKLGVEAPITEEVCAVLHEDKDPKAALASLMTREAKPELG